MRIYGVDFTSAPRREKPIVVAVGKYRRDVLEIEEFLQFSDWPAYEQWIASPGEWIAGFDFPFGLPEAFVARQGLGEEWEAVVSQVVFRGKEWFRDTAMQAFMAARTAKDKHRRTDETAGSHSPLKTRTNPPVGLMFYEGAWRLRRAQALLPGLAEGPAHRVALEAYPGLLANRLGERYYKNDTPASAAHRELARLRLIERLLEPDGDAASWIPCPVRIMRRESRDMLLHSSGDWLDAVLCAVQASWACRRRNENFGLPASIPHVEGWIVSA